MSLPAPPSIESAWPEPFSESAAARPLMVRIASMPTAGTVSAFAVPVIVAEAKFAPSGFTVMVPLCAAVICRTTPVPAVAVMVVLAVMPSKS